MENDYSHMTAGERQLFYRNHSSEIIDYCSRNGFQKTLEYYHMTTKTLTRMLVNGGYNSRNWRSPNVDDSQNDTLLLRIQINEAAIAELRKEIRELKDVYSKFQEEVSNQLVRKFFTPLMQHMQLELPAPADEIEDDIVNQVEMIAAKYDDNTQ